jgi:heparin/heparan-sulfate lyase
MDMNNPGTHIKQDMLWAARELTMLALCILIAGAIFNVECLAGELPEWVGKIRKDHPRLFFDSETWPEVRKRALGPERQWYHYIKGRVDSLLKRADNKDTLDVKEYGQEAAWAAFVYRVTKEERYLDLAKKCLDASLRFYDECFNRRKSVNWYSTSRVHATLAWDWLYEALSEAERRDYMSRLVRAIDRVLKARPTIYRENMSGYSSGFYGVKNCLWFIGCTAFGTGIEEDKVNEWLLWGRNENMKLLEHRRRACGDDGGGASATLGYVLGAYPWSEQNFFYTWLSSTGENIAPEWPHSAWLANYVIWNWIEADRGPLEFGYGDRPHTRNAMPTSQLYTHMANIQHLYGERRPKEAALARYVQELVPRKRYNSSWFIYPFLLTDLDDSPEAFEPEGLPKARHFENMGQIIMRSRTRQDDTYCMFSCGGILEQHRHYDALNFVIYHKGFLALDSGTRYKEFDNGEHLANYYAQTVAHNCVVVHQEGEPPARYWGGTVVGNHGGQHRQLGSVVKAFETNDDYVYVAGDATTCYQHGLVKRAGQPHLGEKCKLVTRQMVFMIPNHFVIFDRVVSTNAGYRKDWLIHTAHEPKITGRTIRADHSGGRMFCRTMLPEDAVLKVVGGPGKEFWAAGKNWDIVPNGLNDENLALMGQWRVEVTPGRKMQKDIFLHVIQVAGQDLEQMNEAELIEGVGRYGVRVRTGKQIWEIVFNSDGPLGGHIKRTGQGKRISRNLTTGVQKQVGIAARTYPAMTYEQAKARIPQRELPGFWVGGMEKLEKQLAEVSHGEVRVIANTPGGRLMHVVSFGERERVPATLGSDQNPPLAGQKANFNSAVGGQAQPAYMDKEARYKPVILFVGPVHGHEVEALTGLTNLISIMDTGYDLRGREQTELRKLGRRCRSLIIPAGNPDGTARLEPRALQGMGLEDVRFWGQGTWSDDTFCGWPESKRQHPMAGENIGFLGCYFNDAGINPMHDEFFEPMGPEAPAILKIAREEGVDLAVSLHSHSSGPALLRPAYVTMEKQEDIRRLAGEYYEILKERGLPYSKVFDAKSEGGRNPSPFNLTSAMYHVSGASSFTFECPHGLSSDRACKVGFEEILDIQLALYEAMMRHELAKKAGQEKIL